jgi:hypothetical protein
MPGEIINTMPFLVGEKSQTHDAFGEDNEMVYHIDGVLTTHTGQVLSKLS